MNVLTKATSAGLDTPLLESQTIQVSTSTGQSLCVGRDEEEDVRQDEERGIRSPRLLLMEMFVCLFVWRSIRGGEDESRKKRRLVQPPLHLQTCLSFYGAEGGREEDLFILRVL